jgi:hypothetical protein
LVEAKNQENQAPKCYTTGKRNEAQKQMKNLTLGPTIREQMWTQYQQKQIGNRAFG